MVAYLALALTPMPAVGQLTPSGSAQSAELADVAARAGDPWETDFVDGTSWMDAIDWDEGLVIGVRDTEQGVTRYRFFGLDIGVEQWQDGRRSGSFRDQWHLFCNGAITAAEPLNCTLDIDRLTWWGGTSGTIVSKEQYQTSTNTLLMRRTDWEAGVIAFALVNPGRPSIEASLQFEYDGDLMRLQDFRAATLSTPLFSDSSVAGLEFRIPEYSYLWYTPMPITGLKKSVQRGWTEMLESLSQADRQAWQQLAARRSELGDVLDASVSDAQIQRLTEERFPRRDRTQDSTAAQSRQFSTVVQELLLDRFGEWLTSSAISDAGQRQIIAYLRQSIDREVVR